MDTPAKPGFFRRFLHNWQEPLVWLPSLLCILVGLFWAIPRLDPRSGIDGFGDLFQLVGGLISLALILFVAWLAKRTYLTELSDEDADFIRTEAADQGHALWVLIIDRLEWLGLIALAYLVLQG